jgi:flagellar biosynthesis/type III secretory pathway protein FliH
MLQQRNIGDEDIDLTQANSDALLPDADMYEYGRVEVRALFPSQLNLLTSDSVLSRECLPVLNNAQAVLAAAQESADLIVQKAQQQAEAMRRNAEVESRLWLDNKRDELLAEMYFQQAMWLSQLQPVWLAALESTLKKVVGEGVRPDAFAHAIALGIKEFKKEADLQLVVHPDDLKATEQAITQLAKNSSQLITVNTDDALSPGVCQLRSIDLEVSFQLDQAINLALGKS